MKSIYSQMIKKYAHLVIIVLVSSLQFSYANSLINKISLSNNTSKSTLAHSAQPNFSSISKTTNLQKLNSIQTYTAATSRIIIELDGDSLFNAASINMGTMPITNLIFKKQNLQNQHDIIRNSLRSFQLTSATSSTSRQRMRDYFLLFNGIAMEVTEHEREYLSHHVGVKAIYDDQKVSINLSDSVPLINADEAWKNYSVTGYGVRVGVIDTGIDYRHLDLGGCLGTQCKVVDGYDFINMNRNPMDDNGHGTHVAGIIGANGSVKGVAPNVSLYAYKVLDAAGSGWYSDIIAGIERAMDPNGDFNTNDHLDIINLSLGGVGTPFDILSQAVDRASQAGILVVVAAGNSGSEGLGSISSPGCARTALTVGASDKTDHIASFSGQGPSAILGDIKPDLVAPGVNIRSTWLNGTTMIENGTSMAAPHVAGVAALLKQAHPELSSNQLKSIMMETAIDLSNDLFVQGSGRINAMTALGSSVIIEPASVGFGQVDVSIQSTSTSQTFSLTNQTGITLSLSLVPLTSLPPGATISGNINKIIIAPYSVVTRSLLLVIDNATLSYLTNPNVPYKGRIIYQITATNNDSLIPQTYSPIQIMYSFRKSIELRIHTDQIPYVIHLHDQQNHEQLIYPNSRDSVVNLPSGIWDVVVNWFSTDSDDFVVYHELEISQSRSITINRKEACYTLNSAVIDENKKSLIPNLRFYTLTDTTTDKEISFISDGRPLRMNAVSNVYQLDIHNITYQPNKVYQFFNRVSGINSNLQLNTFSEQLQRIPVYSILPGQTATALVYNSFEYHESTYYFTNFDYLYDIKTQPLTLYFAKETATISTNFLWLDIYDQLNDQNAQELAYTQRLKVNAQGQLLAYPIYGHDLQYQENKPTTLAIGLGPVSLPCQMLNDSLQLNVTWKRVSDRQFGSFFLNTFVQSIRGDVLLNNNIQFTLSHNQKVISHASLISAGTYGIDIAPDTIFLPEPGQYSLTLNSPIYLINNHEGFSRYSAEINTILVDKNPPVLTHIDYLMDGHITNEIIGHHNNLLQFSIFDAESSVKSATSFYRIHDTTLFIPLSNQCNNSLCTATLPEFSKEELIDIAIELTDNSGNSMRYEALPAFHYSVPDCEAPTLNFPNQFKIYKGNTLSFLFVASISENINVTYSAISLPMGAIISKNEFSWTPLSHQSGDYSISIIAVAPDGLMSQKTITISVYEPWKYSINESLSLNVIVFASNDLINQCHALTVNIESPSVVLPLGSTGNSIYINLRQTTPISSILPPDRTIDILMPYNGNGLHPFVVYWDPNSLIWSNQGISIITVNVLLHTILFTTSRLTSFLALDINDIQPPILTNITINDKSIRNGMTLPDHGTIKLEISDSALGDQGLKMWNVFVVNHETHQIAICVTKNNESPESSVMINVPFSASTFDPNQQYDLLYSAADAADISNQLNNVVSDLKPFQAFSISSFIAAPNPINIDRENLHLVYDLTSSAFVEIKIFALTGELIYQSTFLENSIGARFGHNEVIWDGRNTIGNKVANGLYYIFFQATFQGKTLQRKWKTAVIR